MCSKCAAKLSPFFTGRKKSTLDEIKAQLAYREQNRQNLNYFNATRVLGNNTKVYIDDTQAKFVISRKSDYRSENADIIEIARVISTRYEVEEHKSEIDEFRYAYRYLMKHGAEKDGSSLSIDLGKLAEEEAQLTARISKADTQISGIASDLSQLRQIRYYLGKVMPETEEIREIVRTDPDRRVSVLVQLARNRKLFAERKNDTDKRNGTYREELS
jgi:hypothetical protein